MPLYRKPRKIKLTDDALVHATTDRSHLLSRVMADLTEAAPALRLTAASKREGCLLENQIVTGDCLTVLNSLPSESVDLIVTSPPYNFGLQYDSHNDTGDFLQYFHWLHQVWAECARVLVPGGRICVNVQPLPSSYLPTHHIVSSQLMALGLLFKGEILWEKNNYNCKYTAWGSWRSPSMPYLKITWEFVEVFCKGSQKKPGPSSQSDLTADEFKKWTTVKWVIAPTSKMRELGHPAVFPEELPRRLIKLFSFKDALVLDPFNGVGTTTLVAQQLARRYVGIDISDMYCQTARRRLADDCEKTSLLRHHPPQDFHPPATQVPAQTAPVPA